MREPRHYQGEPDLKAMRNLLIAGRKANNGSYYIHSGDLNWWLYFPPLDGDYWEHIYLWDDPDIPGELLGWALISPDWVGIDVYIRPDLRGSPPADEMYGWTEDRATQIAQRVGKKATNSLWILQNDEVLGNHFTQRGYRLAKGCVQFSRNLDGTLLPSQVVGEFRVRACRGEDEVDSRARAQHGAFSSEAPFERYLERFRKFMRSPVYCHNLDIVATCPNGEIGAFCIIWMDPVNKVGLFEPVGTHPDYQRKGLGKAVMLEGLRRLQAGGMQQAIVSTGEDNLPAIKLYEKIGFRIVNQLGTYQKDV